MLGTHSALSCVAASGEYVRTSVGRNVSNSRASCLFTCQKVLEKMQMLNGVVLAATLCISDGQHHNGDSSLPLVFI